MRRELDRVIRQKLRFRGFTLLELLVSLLASTALIVGLSSSLFIATQIVTPPTRSDRVAAQSSMEIEQLLQDLRYASLVHELSDRVIDVNVADRDSDDHPERIRISWSGVAGAPVIRQVNDDEGIVLMQNVHVWDVDSQALESSEVVSIGVTLQVGASSEGLVRSRIDLPNRPTLPGE